MKRLSRFSNNLRIKIVEHDNPEMVGLYGNVVRLRHADDGAWVRMDERIDCNNFPFPSGDPRSHHTMLYPEQCEKAMEPFASPEDDMERARR